MPAANQVGNNIMEATYAEPYTAMVAKNRAWARALNTRTQRNKEELSRQGNNVMEAIYGNSSSPGAQRAENNASRVLKKRSRNAKSKAESNLGLAKARAWANYYKRHGISYEEIEALRRAAGPQPFYPPDFPPSENSYEAQASVAAPGSIAPGPPPGDPGAPAPSASNNSKKKGGRSRKTRRARKTRRHRSRRH